VFEILAPIRKHHPYLYASEVDVEVEITHIQYKERITSSKERINISSPYKSSSKSVHWKTSQMGIGNDGDGGIFVARNIDSTNHLISNMSMVSDAESIHMPLPKRYPPVGLKNWGNTCYANAALQCLLSTALARALMEPKCFREFKRYASNVHLLNKELQPSNSFSTDDQTSSKYRNRRRKQVMSDTCHWITKELTYLCQYYTGDPARIRPTNTGLLSYFTKQPAVLDPGKITRQVSRLSPCLRIGRQEDAHEFLRALISNLVMDGQNRKLSALFDGLLESAVTCQHCGHSSLTRDRYMDISLEIQGNGITDLRGAFQRFTTTEHLSPDNMVVCEPCGVKRRVTKGLRLATAPTILVCHLKRFDYDIFGRVVRLNKKVDFPLRLEIGDFMSRANRSKPPPYELVSVLVHQGRSCDSGHYLSYVKSDGEWYRANDEQVEKVPVNVVLAQRAYILVYEVEGMRNHKIRHSTYDSKSFDGSLHSKSLGSRRSRHSVGSAITARSEPNVLSSIFHLMGSCGVLPNEIDCCNVNINKVHSEDDRSKASRVRRTLSDQDRKSRSDRKQRGSKARAIKSLKSASKDETMSMKSSDRSARRKTLPERRSSEIPEEEPARLSTHRTMSEPIHFNVEMPLEEEIIHKLDSSAALDRQSANQFDVKYVSPTNSFDSSSGQFSNNAESSIVSCCSDSMISSGTFGKITRKSTKKSQIIKDEHRVTKVKAQKLLQHTPTKRIVRSSSSNNLRERSVEAANAYRGTSNRSKMLDSDRNAMDNQGVRSSSRSRSGMKLRLRYISPKKSRSEIFEYMRRDKQSFDSVSQLSRSAHGALQSSPPKVPGPIKMKRRILSTGGPSQLPPLPASRDSDCIS